MEVPIIYALRDPRDGSDRYIGFSKNRPGQRLGHHLAHAIEGKKNPCAVWIRELMASGLLPSIHVVKEDATYDDEVAEIAARRSVGIALLNVTDGGPGSPGKRGPMSEEQKAKLRGRKWTDEQRAAASAARKGKKMPPRSDDHRANLSKAKTGIKASDATRAKLSEAHKGHPWHGVTPDGIVSRSLKVAQAKARIRVERFGADKISSAVEMVQSGGKLKDAAAFLGCTNRTMRRLVRGSHLV